MKDYNVESTVEVIKKIAETMRYYADQVDNQGDAMLKDGDLSRAAEVFLSVNSMLNNARLDFLITRPLRETMK